MIKHVLLITGIKGTGKDTFCEKGLRSTEKKDCPFQYFIFQKPNGTVENLTQFRFTNFQSLAFARKVKEDVNFLFCNVNNSLAFEHCKNTMLVSNKNISWEKKKKHYDNIILNTVHKKNRKIPIIG